MKVCILTTSFPAYKGDSQGHFIYRFIKALAENNVNVTVVCPYYKKSRSQHEIYDGIKIVRFKYFPKKFQTLTEVGSIADAINGINGQLQALLLCISYLIKSLKVAKKSDIIHAQWATPSGFIGLVLKWIYRKPLIITTRGTDVSKSLRSHILKTLLIFLLNHCDYVTSNNTKHIAVFKRLGIKTKMVYIPNGLDYSLFKKRHKLTARKKLKISKDDKIVLFVGHLIKVKGVNLLLHVLKELKKDNIKLLIVGDGPLKVVYLSTVKHLGLEKNIYFVGSVSSEHIAHYMNAADLLVLPSYSEGRSNVIIEAMASGLPVISTDVGDVRDIIVNQRDGFIVRVGDKNAIINRIRILFSDKNLSRKISRNALKAVKNSNPSWHECGEKYISVYSKMIRE